MFELAAEYVGIEPPVVNIPRDYENKMIDGNTITAYLQLFMQNAISQETLLRILQEGEVLPATIDIGEELEMTANHLQEQMAMNSLNAKGPDMAFQNTLGYNAPEEPSSNAGQGTNLNSQTLPTPMRPGVEQA